MWLNRLNPDKRTIHIKLELELQEIEHFFLSPCILIMGSQADKRSRDLWLTLLA